jgi:zinc transporter ZupT
MSVLLCDVKSKITAILYLTLFSLASPLGLYLNNLLLSTQAMSPRTFTFLFALVCGSFLHISTTIVFESSADHKFHARKMSVAVLAATLAVASELLF